MKNNNWVSVKDRLPENNDAVLFYVKNGIGFLVGYFENEHWVETFGRLYCERIEDGTVTHWMPIPNPPEE